MHDLIGNHLRKPNASTRDVFMPPQESKVASQPRVRGAIQAIISVPGPCGEIQWEYGEEVVFECDELQ